MNQDFEIHYSWVICKLCQFVTAYFMPDAIQHDT